MQRYDTYKYSGVKWLGEIPSHWEVIKTSHLFTHIGSGTTPKSGSEEYYTEDGIPFLQTGDLNDGFIVDTSKKITEKALRDTNLTIYLQGSLVIAMYGATIGKLGILGIDTTVNQACCVLPKSPKVETRYAFYAYLAAKNDLIFQSKGGGQPNISQDTIKNERIPVPSRAEQTAIANYLDTATAKIDAAIAQQQKMIDLLNERKQIIINRAVTKGLNPNAKMKDSGVEWIGEVPEGWGCRKLKSICANTQYSIKTGPFGSQLKGDDIQEFGDVPIYNQRVVIDNDCSLFNSYVSKAKAASLKSFVVNSKDLLITTRGTIGKSTIVPNDAPDGILHPCIIAIRLNFDLCCNEYLQFFFQSIAFNTDMMLKSNVTTIEVIYSYNLKECFVPLPPIDEQKQIVEYLNKELVRINQTIDATNNQISHLQERKQIIIDEVVTGKIKI